MASRGATTINLVTPLIIFLFLGTLAVAGFFGVKSAMASMPGSEMACTITKFEPVEGSSDSFLLHTDGCMDSKTTEKVFKLQMEGSLKESFTELGFYNGKTSKGAIYNLQIEGMNIPKLDMVPNVVGISKSIMPY